MMELVHKRAQEAHKDIEKNAKKIYNFKNIRRFEIFWRNMQRISDIGMWRKHIKIRFINK